MAAMFKYSPVATYTVSLPPQKLEFSNSIRTDLKEEYDKVCLYSNSCCDYSSNISDERNVGLPAPTFGLTSLMILC